MFHAITYTFILKFRYIFIYYNVRSAMRIWTILEKNGALFGIHGVLCVFLEPVTLRRGMHIHNKRFP